MVAIDESAFYLSTNVIAYATLCISWGRSWPSSTRLRTGTVNVPAVSKIGPKCGRRVNIRTLKQWIVWAGN